MKGLKKKWRNCLFALALIVGGTAVLLEDSVTAYAVSDNKAMPLNDTFFSGRIDEKGEADFYNFTIAAPGWVTITYQGWNIYDSYYAVCSSDYATEYEKHEIYASSDTNPKTHSVTLALEAGDYVVKVWGYGSRIGDYKLKGSYKAAGNNEKEPNNEFGLAMPLGQDNQVTGFFSRQDRVDFYTFNLMSPATVDVILTSSIRDMYFSVWNKDFVRVKENNVWYASESSPKTSTIQLNLDAGTYYIKCNPSYDYTGKYQLKWKYAPTLVKTISIGGNKTVAAGKSLKLTASVMPTNANNKQVEWKSSNTSVATVNADTGKVSTKATGYTVITATAKDGSNVSTSVTVMVKPKKMSRPKVKALGNKKVRITWKKQSGTTKYQVQYAKKSNFKGARRWSYSSYYNQAAPKLKKKGTYYFRIRSVSTVNGQTLNGEWSKSIKVKVK